MLCVCRLWRLEVVVCCYRLHIDTHTHTDQTNTHKTFTHHPTNILYTPRLHTHTHTHARARTPSSHCLYFFYMTTKKIFPSFLTNFCLPLAGFPLNITSHPHPHLIYTPRLAQCCVSPTVWASLLWASCCTRLSS